MKFERTGLEGVFRILAEPREDARGFFARIYCPDEFANAGIAFTSTQINLSRNTARHTLRGMHWQDAPFAEAKVVRCLRGRIYDVVADIRRDSPTFGRWIACELDAVTANALYIPEGCAHGFLTLEADTDVLYQMGRMYEPGQARGFRYDDPAFAIQWPAVPSVVGEADLKWPGFDR
jgi:dTDP-4-dehydrorhamnose 3,5-epimerase